MGEWKDNAMWRHPMPQVKAENLRQEVAKMNKEKEYWHHYRIQAAIAAMQSYISDGERMTLVSKKFDYDDKIIFKFIAEGAVMYADALIEELKKGVNDDNI